jgi:hypothetical protein
MVPEQMVWFDPMVPLYTWSFTFTSTVFTPWQLFASVPITVYTRVEVGFAFTDEPLVADKPLPGSTNKLWRLKQ